MEAFGPRMFIKTERYEPDESGKYTFNGQPFRLEHENEWTGNLLISSGRKYLGQLLVGLASGGFLWCAAGSSTVAIDALNDDRLGGYVGSATPAFEYIGSATRKQLQSTLYGGNLTNNDLVQETFVNNGITYYWKIQATVTYGPSDPNGTASGVPLQRYGLCLASPTPTTTSGTSGIMLNELIDVAPQTLTSSNVIKVNFILRF